MSKKRNKMQGELPVLPQQELKPNRFVPRPCASCETDRPKGTSFSKVYHTRDNVRYCKCEFCGRTWAQYSDNRTSTIVHTHEKIVTQESSTPSLEHGNICGPVSTS